MTFPATFAVATPITPPSSSVKSRTTFPLLCTCSSDSHLTLKSRTTSTYRRSNLLPSIKSAASDSTVTVDNPTRASTSSEEEEIPAKIGARVRVKVPLKVYHVPKVAEVELNGKEGKVKDYVAVWKGKQISANLPYKIEFLEVLEGRGDAPVKFFAHLKEDEFEYLD